MVCNLLWQIRVRAKDLQVLQLPRLAFVTCTLLEDGWFEDILETCERFGDKMQAAVGGSFGPGTLILYSNLEDGQATVYQVYHKICLNWHLQESEAATIKHIQVHNIIVNVL